jgi:hypothetical protein
MCPLCAWLTFPYRRTRPPAAENLLPLGTFEKNDIDVGAVIYGGGDLNEGRFCGLADSPFSYIEALLPYG